MTAVLPSSAQLAVVGGGPAGSLLAAALAAAGRSTLLLEEKPEWEKPCGGGLTDKALARYPFLMEAVYPRNWVDECELASPGGRRLLLKLDRRIAIFSRQVLNRLLLDRARRAGAQFVPERVVRCTPEAAGWRLELRGGGAVRAAAVFNAAGARNPLSAALPTPLAAQDWMATAGYYVPTERLPWPANRMIIQFLPGLEGYIWSFPRPDHASIGICGRIGSEPTAGLRRWLEGWLDTQGVAWRDARFYAHLLPAPTPASLHRARFGAAAPHPWMLVGDAAGLVDPITGEGLYYALRSAELLAAAVLAAGSLDDVSAAYDQALRRELVAELAAAGRIAPRFFHGRFLGGSVLERMTVFGQRSSIFRQLLCDLFSGVQGYVGLRGRLYRNLGPSLIQLALA